MDPTLAPLVLDAISGRTELAAVLLKGDALRLLGRHLEAELAYAGAAGHLEPPPSSETDPDSRPPATLKEPS
jgi:hypothetical protein